MLALGTNDLKIRYGLDPLEIANNLEKLYLEKIKEIGNKCMKNIIVGPPYINFGSMELSEKFPPKTAFDELANIYKQLSTKYLCGFIDLRGKIYPGIDGVHFGEEAHMVYAELIYNEVMNQL